jgi:hypothetical protein
MWGRWGGHLVVAAALCAAVSEAAEGAVQAVGRTDREIGREVTDVSLAGESVVWGELSPYRLDARRTWTVRLGRAGQPVRTRFRSRTPPTTLGLEVPRAAASATHLAVMPTYVSDDGLRRYRLLAGTLEGPLVTLNDSILWSPALLDWSGGVLVAREGERPGPALTARDAAGGFTARSLPLDPNVRALRVAGSFVAALTIVGRVGESEAQLDARIDVSGLDGEARYSVTAEDSFIWDFAVQDDGKVAWLQRRHVNSGPGALAWASGAEPWAHVVARDVPVGGVPIGLGRDRILFGRRVHPRRASWQPWVSDLAGAARPTWFALRAEFEDMRADFDGERLAVAAGGCVWVGDVDKALSGAPGGRCPQAVTGEGRRRVRRGGSRYAYTFPCLMAPPRGCRGVARYEVARRERGRRTVVAVRRFRARLGELATVRFRVPRQRLRRMRNRAGTVWLFVSVRSTDAYGRTSVSESFEYGIQP